MSFRCEMLGEDVVYQATLYLVVEKRKPDRLEMARLESLSARELMAELCAALRDERHVAPNGVGVVKCRWCDAGVCWIPSGSHGLKQSLAFNAPGCYAPTVNLPGVGFPHLADCPGSGLRW